MVSKVFEHPFDLVKVRLQSQPLDRPVRYTGALDCFRQSFAHEGFRGLYRVRSIRDLARLSRAQGLSMPLVGAMAENATLFVVYNQTQALLRHMRPVSFVEERVAEVPIGEIVVAGAAAGAAASFVLTPIELVKCRMQVQMIGAEAEALRRSVDVGPLVRARMPGAVGVAMAQIRSSGFGGLWLGQTGTLLREGFGSAGWFFTFEFITRLFQRRLGPDARKSDLSVWHYAAGGFCAGTVFTSSTFPADCIKSAIQVQEELGGPGAKRSFLQTGGDIFRARGIRGLYSGCLVSCIKSAPSSAMIFVIYSMLERASSR